MPVRLQGQYQQFRKKRTSWSWLAAIPLSALIVLVSHRAAIAQDLEPLTPETVKGLVDTIWILVAAILVIFMNAGFGMLETGFCRQKNAINILSKNLIVFALATIAYWAFGFSLMFANGNAVIGFGGWFLTGDSAIYGLDPFPEGLPVSVFFLFQVAFAGTAATIVSGAVAERIKFRSFMIFSFLLVAFGYSVTGHWVWSETGWLGSLGFKDFAGSTVVHSVGGWAALVGAYLLGPREGKYLEDGTMTGIPPHNMSIATLGGLILWIGWFGFNPGSELEVNLNVPDIALTTNLAAASGAIAATITVWLRFGLPDLSMIINGVLAGLVAITASCNGVSYFGAVMIGAVAGILVVFSVTLFDRLKIDDPVGAISVHLVNGIWGTLAVGIFHQELASPSQFLTQIFGILVVAIYTVILSLVFWFALKYLIGIRVDLEEEREGLDIGEHGMEAYSGFVQLEDVVDDDDDEQETQLMAPIED
ncbi:ammonium transporter [Halothece sp. PCC 7418]|uniref:ammonium transporter n=1 Tax=Halothece sp. (strain PCC 7418) TaxID=65093 RepID=UPI0002A076EE|nr:ammonium transporter [Halothece sp. PCC 7418]AFZ43978.1 ammonium transporter [Halothece sp. PCC 7418]